MQTQAARAAALVNQLGLSRLGRASRALHFLSISNAGLMAITTLVAGGCNVITNETSAEGLMALIRHHRITHLTAVPFVAERLLAAPTAIRAGLSELDCLMMFGSPIEPDVLAQCIEVAGQSVIYAYGSTEAPMPVTALASAHYAGSADVDDRLLKSAGWPTPAWDVSVHSAEGQRMASGHGELLVRGTGQLIGYWGDPEASAAVLDGDGWYATGDLATIADDGLVTIEGRLREFLISGGYNVYPAEVERRLVEHPSVAEAAVVGLEDRTWGEIVAAFVVPVPRAAPTPTELVSWTREALAAYKRPRRLVMVDELPRGPFGKVRKAELVKRFDAEPGLGVLSDD
jgi:acyl-CoA synthetase (AMP-forming)/AMP-acid ligase II